MWDGSAGWEVGERAAPWAGVGPNAGCCAAEQTQPPAALAASVLYRGQWLDVLITEPIKNFVPLSLPLPTHTQIRFGFASSLSHHVSH